MRRALLIAAAVVALAAGVSTAMASTGTTTLLTASPSLTIIGEYVKLTANDSEFSTSRSGWGEGPTGTGWKIPGRRLTISLPIGCVPRGAPLRLAVM